MSRHTIIVVGVELEHVASGYDWEPLVKEPQHGEGNDCDDIWSWLDREVLDWLADKCTGKWAVFTDDGEEVAAFEHEADLIFFTDTWTKSAE